MKRREEGGGVCNAHYVVLQKCEPELNEGVRERERVMEW